MQTSHIVFGILIIGILGATRESAATSCDVRGAVASAAQGATAIFIATVTKVTLPQPEESATTNPAGSITVTLRVVSGQPRRVDLAIEESFKGSMSGRLQLESDYPFAANGRYLIYQLESEPVASSSQRVRAFDSSQRRRRI